MAGNDWLNGYLEAIIDTGERVASSRASADREDKEFEVLTATKYFVNEVTGYDDIALYRTWVKASAVKYPRERGNRMEYLCWRIWHVARKKKKLAWEDAQQMARLHIGKDLLQFNDSEDFSEGEKLDSSSSSDPLILSDAAVAADPVKVSGIHEDQEKGKRVEKRLYIVLISLHGLVRGEHMELGRDSDTGGQVKYVVELARALAMMPEVYRVDLLTRQICAPEVDWSYGEPTEMLSPGSYDNDDSEIGESGGAYIVRIPCGPRDQYIRKELLWPDIQEFVDGALAHVLNMAKVLGDQLTEGQSVWPHVIHGHYADAGDIASLLSGALNVPMVLTGHSLGRNKLDQILKQGRQSMEDINSTYKIMRRLEAEELSLDAAELVITSTKQEIDEQWGLYDGFDFKTERILRARALRGVSCHGRFMPRMSVIPPGMEFKNVVVQDVGDMMDGDREGAALNGPDVPVPASPRAPADPIIWSEIMRFFTNPHKPMILALARPDPKKNIMTLLKAFGECRPLRELANLTLVMGNREDIDSMTGGNASVLTTALKLIDKYDLYGQVAYPKRHTQTDVPEIYRLAAKTKGVFINPALVEPFGLTLIEAAAHGLPMVATKNGGPVDIHRTLNNGLLVDPHDQKSISDALLQILADRKFWTECRQNGLKNIHLFSWPEHCRTYLSRIAMCRMRHPKWQNDNSLYGDVQVDSQGDSLRDVHDILLRLSIDGDKLPKAASGFFKIGNDKPVENGERVSIDAGASIAKNSIAVLNDLYSAFSAVNVYGDTKKSLSNTEQRASVVSGGCVQTKTTILRRRKRLVIIAVDSFDSNTGQPTLKSVQLTKDIFKAFRSESSGRWTGFILSTSLTGPETLEFLISGGISLNEFDALICASGSEIFYPAGWSNYEDAGLNSILCPDPDYKDHIAYRWGGEGLRKTMLQVSSMNGEHSIWDSKSERALIEDVQRCNSHCFAYEVTNSSNVPRVDQLRQRLRKKGLRCHVMYCQRESKLHVIPLLASRSQALRYLFVRWGVDVANMFVFVGETGDTDYEELLAGTHKTIILKGAVEGGSERLLRSSGGYTREDIAPSESPNILTTEDDSTSSILAALKNFGLDM